MDTTGVPNVKATLLIKQSEIDFVVNLLNALKIKGIVDFKVDKEPSIPDPSSEEWTAVKLNAVIEKSEKSGDMSLEDFKAKHEL